LTEAQHQTALFNWVWLVRNKYPELALLYHVPNGGSRNKIEAANLKRQGVKPGVPDLCLPVPRGQYHGLYIELKTEKGRTSTAQDWWIRELNAQGYFTEVCHGWESAVRVIEWYMNLKGETK
jgi:hypothetical protein